MLATALITLSATIAVRTALAELTEQPGPAVIDPTWDPRPTTLAELVDASDAVVIATVAEVRRGDPIVGEHTEVGNLRQSLPADPLGGPSDAELLASASDEQLVAIGALPTQRIDLDVGETVVGDLSGRFTLFKLGGSSVGVGGDPAYLPGERYLLFLKRRLNDERTAPNADATWLPAAPDGRLEALASGRVAESLDGGLADQLDGDSLAGLVNRVEASAGDGS